METENTPTPGYIKAKRKSVGLEKNSSGTALNVFGAGKKGARRE
jgi:hypothetical protein